MCGGGSAATLNKASWLLPNLSILNDSSKQNHSSTIILNPSTPNFFYILVGILYTKIVVWYTIPYTHVTHYFMGLSISVCLPSRGTGSLFKDVYVVNSSERQEQKAGLLTVQNYKDNLSLQGKWLAELLPFINDLVSLSLAFCSSDTNLLCAQHSTELLFITPVKLRVQEEPVETWNSYFLLFCE